MKYFLDTEFVEGVQTNSIPWLILKKRGGGLSIGKAKPTIDLISIGIVAEDGREYYAISKEFNLKEAWDRYQLNERKDYENYSLKDRGKILYNKEYWLRDNVLKPIYNELLHKYNSDGYLPSKKRWDYKEFKMLINKYGKTNKQIAKEIIEFCKPIEGNPLMWNKKGYEVVNIGKENSYMEPTFGVDYIGNRTAPEFYGYYSDYDWVVFCWLFGKMTDLPNGFPYYCIDLKQTLDEKANTLTSFELSKLAHSDIVTHNVYSTYDTGVLKCSKTDLLKNALNYPKQTNEHNALADARWNYELYKFLKNEI